MKPTEAFKYVGAPLRNSRWSWGGVRADGAVFLRVWQDRKRVHEGVLHFRVTSHERYREDPENLGYKERLEHVARINAGAHAYLIVAIAEDVDAHPREIKSVVDDVFVGGRPVELDGDTWIPVTERIPLRKLRA